MRRTSRRFSGNGLRCAPRQAVLAVTLLFGLVPAVAAQTAAGTAFTYQGRLDDGGTPANGPYDFRFILYDTDVGGSQVGPTVTVDDVAVVQGLFTVGLDFGPGAFVGDARFVEIGVRPGPSTGAYTLLGTRQKLTPGPHAVFSQVAPWTGISGKPPGFDDDTDDDALGGLSCANGELAKWNGTAWACAADVDTNSGGTVTSVGTGAGLTGGPISTTGTVSVATGGITTALLADSAVTSPKIANGAVGLNQINTGEVQARVGGTCPPGQYLSGINPDGTVACEPFFAPPTTVDDLGGPFTSIAIGTDGLPVISYYSNSAAALKVAHCGNASCTAGNTLTIVDDPANLVGEYTSIAIGTDGLPVISYYDNMAGALKVAHCGNASCTTGNTLTTVDDPPVNRVGQYTSIAIGTDGLPVISYYDATAFALKVAHCGNASCTTGNVVTTVDDPVNSVGRNTTSIAIGTDGLPVISYYDATAFALKVAHCGNASCTTGNTLTTFAIVGVVDRSTSIAIGTNGLPVISYYDASARALKVAHCGNASCTFLSAIATVDDPVNFVGEFMSIAIGTDGLPVISYWDSTAGALKVARCGDPVCTTGNVLTTVDDPANLVGAYTSIAIGTDGLPVISYYDYTAQALKVAKCSTRTCQ